MSQGRRRRASSNCGELNNGGRPRKLGLKESEAEGESDSHMMYDRKAMTLRL